MIRTLKQKMFACKRARIYLVLAYLFAQLVINFYLLSLSFSLGFALSLSLSLSLTLAPSPLWAHFFLVCYRATVFCLFAICKAWYMAAKTECKNRRKTPLQKIMKKSFDKIFSVRLPGHRSNAGRRLKRVRQPGGQW